MNQLDVRASLLNACDELQAYLQSEAPDPNDLETKTTTLRAALRALGGRSLLGLKIPLRWGGSQISDLDYFVYQE
ncbi:MAG: hypothetical protein HC838_15705, partial [Spirulinaceae cyanobacterium RM2_2_10]|nr:hypothetical protein [Spirulinaceae cyanobacterium RM2_2_10]